MSEAHLKRSLVKGEFKEIFIGSRGGIQRVYNPELMDLLIYRYIKGMTQEQTAEKMNISMSYLKKQEKLALKVFELENNVQNTQKIVKKFVRAKTVKKKINVL